MSSSPNQSVLVLYHTKKSGGEGTAIHRGRREERETVEDEEKLKGEAETRKKR